MKITVYKDICKGMYGVIWNLEGELECSSAVKKEDIDSFLATMGRVERVINAGRWKQILVEEEP